MAAPSTTVLDAFTGDGALSANWTVPLWSGEAAPTRVAGQMKAAASFSSAYWNPGQFAADQEAYCTYQAGRVLLNLRCQQPGAGALDCYEVDFNVPAANTGAIYQIANEVSATLATFTLDAVSPGDGLWAAVIGQTVYCYVKPAAGSWTLKGSATGTGVTGPGYIGPELGANAIIDGFGGGTLTGGRSIATTRRRRR